MNRNYREVDVKEVMRAVRKLCISACTELNPDMVEVLKKSCVIEESSIGKTILEQLVQNAEIARNESIPMCQDTGFTIVFLEIGQNILFSGGNLNEAVQEGVGSAYKEGFLRKSIVKNGFTQPENTGDNTPPIIHTEVVPGNQMKITVMPKGAGSENMSRIRMLKPADGMPSVLEFILETVEIAGANPCPPIIVGVGLGGTFDFVAYLAKKSLLRKIGERSPDPNIAQYEIDWLMEVNKLGIGPAGLGGKITALELFIETFPRHIAAFPVAVNIQCNAARYKSCIL